MQTIDTSKNWELLAMKIVHRAVKDYETARGQMEGLTPEDFEWKVGKLKVDDIKSFFYSSWFVELMNVDGPALYSKIEDNYNKYRRSMLYDLDEDGVTEEMKNKPNRGCHKEKWLHNLI